MNVNQRATDDQNYGGLSSTMGKKYKKGEKENKKIKYLLYLSTINKI